MESYEIVMLVLVSDTSAELYCSWKVNRSTSASMSLTHSVRLFEQQPKCLSVVKKGGRLLRQKTVNLQIALILSSCEEQDMHM